MDGSTVNKDALSTPQQNKIDSVRQVALLRNSIQLINSGSLHADQNHFDVATNPTLSSFIVNGGIPLGPKLLQQQQSRRLGSTVHPLPYQTQIPFRHRENSHTAFYRYFPAARRLPNPGRRWRSSSSNRRPSTFIPQPTWTH